MLHITLTGDPKSTQHCYKYTCRGGYVQSYMDSKCTGLKEDYAWQARAQHVGPPIAEPLKITMHLYHGTKRRSDIDNFNKLVFDALSDIVYGDDSQIEHLTIIKGYDKENPRVELVIEELS